MDKSSFGKESSKSRKDALLGEMSEQAKAKGCLNHEASQKLLNKMKNAK